MIDTDLDLLELDDDDLQEIVDDSMDALTVIPVAWRDRLSGLEDDGVCSCWECANSESGIANDALAFLPSDYP